MGELQRPKRTKNSDFPSADLAKRYGYATVSTADAAKLFSHDGRTMSSEWVRKRLETGDLTDGAPPWQRLKRPTVVSIAALLDIPLAEVYEKIEVLS